MSRKLKTLHSKLSRYEKIFRNLKAQEAKGPLNDYQKNQLRHYKNLLKEGSQNIQREELRVETKANKKRLNLAQEIESDKKLVESLSATKGVTSMNERQIRAQENSVQKRLTSNQGKFDKINFSEGAAKFDNQGDQFKFSSPEGRYVFKDNAEQLRFDSNLAKAGIASLPNFNTGTGVPKKDDTVQENPEKGTTETSGNKIIDNTITTKTNEEKTSDELKIKGSIDRWMGRGSGRTLTQANEQSMVWLQEQGYDTSKLNKYNSADALQRLRISGPHYTKSDRSMIRIGDTVLKKKLKIKPETPGAVVG